MSYNQALVLLSRLVCVPKCAGCGERLAPISKRDNLSYGKVCMCGKCMEAWQRAKTEMCHTCFKPAGECTCTSWTKKIKQPFVPSLFFYHQDRSRVQNRVLFSAKTKRYPELFDFLSCELAPTVNKLLTEQGIDVNDCIITWIPRKPRAIRTYGHDQAKMLALALAKRLNLKLAVALTERRGGKEQKKLEKSARAKNTEQSVFLKTRFTSHEKKMIREAFPELEKPTVRALVEGKTVIVVDDIITTGASMRRAILLLEPERPSRVLTVCVARSEIKSKSK